MTPNVRKAYRQYMEKHNLKPTLCTYPVMYFVDQNGETIKQSIQAIYQDLGWSLNPTTGRWSPAKNRKKEKSDGSR